MSHRRPDPRQAGLEQALRHALRLTVDSVEPAADGLDRILAQIAARPRAVRIGWPARHLGGLPVALSSIWRFLEPAAIWLRYWAGAVAERFRPDLGRVGWLGWLRPAAAVATRSTVAAAAAGRSHPSHPTRPRSGRNRSAIAPVQYRSQIAADSPNRHAVPSTARRPGR